MTEPGASPASNDFVRALVRQDNAQGTFRGRVQPRFHPQQLGYLHFGNP